MDVFSRELGLTGCRPSSASGGARKLGVPTVVKRPRSSIGKPREEPPQPGQCTRCEKNGVIAAGSGSSFCEQCFECVIMQKKDARLRRKR